MSAIWRPQRVEVLMQWCVDILQDGVAVTDWERHFVSDMERKLLDGAGLSRAQHEKLEAIYAERTK